ncbi:MAG: hypothetical protein EZS28_046415, partial [Streblomastix strix]
MSSSLSSQTPFSHIPLDTCIQSMKLMPQGFVEPEEQKAIPKLKLISPPQPTSSNTTSDAEQDP